MTKLVTLYFFILSLTLCFQSSFGQTGASDSTQSKTEHENEPDNQNRLFFSPGFVYQNIFMGEVGIIYGIKVEGRGYNRLRQYSVLSGVKLSMEFFFNFNTNIVGDNTILGPKLSYEIRILRSIGGRLNVINYTDFTVNDICITPEAGFLVPGFLNVFYGYNIHLSNTRFKEISNHRLSVTLKAVYQKV
ncbi:MAG: hypothetical protein JST20_02145 [Bacteroidetes bacterium]|nr:hypothetical protein [Bacteroidota bacterium]